MLADFPKAKYIILGMDPESRQGRALARKAQHHGVAARVSFLGYHEDVPAIMAAADIFVHPARQETTGAAILEAVVNGLPVIVTENCGYADHVTRAGAGIVIPEPYSRHKLGEALVSAGVPTNTRTWSANGARYGAREELYCGLDEAARIIVEKLSQMTGRRKI
jgi:UDP-glucose:(heptosyl)LPS alpha-1,3-glucosyltransferase